MRTLSFWSAVMLLGVVEAAVAQPAYVVPGKRTEAGPFKEGEASFSCPGEQVMTGRRHSGDENGSTWYECANLMVQGWDPKHYQIMVGSYEWSEWKKESSGDYFRAPQGRVIVGREHKGDHNEDTRYQTAVVVVNNKATLVGDSVESEEVKESSGEWLRSPTRMVMTGRQHSGDENGKTKQQYSVVQVDPAVAASVQALMMQGSP